MTEIDNFESQRIDSWLWHARFFKTRSLCARFVEQGHIRHNGIVTNKPSKRLHIGDVLTIPTNQTVRVIKITGFAEHRVSASKATQLYNEINEKYSRNKEIL